MLSKYPDQTSAVLNQLIDFVNANKEKIEKL